MRSAIANGIQSVAGVDVLGSVECRPPESRRRPAPTRHSIRTRSPPDASDDKIEKLEKKVKKAKKVRKAKQRVEEVC